MTEVNTFRSRTPVRISFVGGGSDFPSFYTQESGSVVSTSINKYLDITLSTETSQISVHIGDDKIKTYNRVEDIDNKIIATTLSYAQIERPFALRLTSDVPPGSGLGSSSALVVGILAAAYASQNIFRTSHELAEEASYVELELLRSPIGKQDQYACALGGLNHFRFHTESVTAEKLYVPQPHLTTLRRHLLLLFTGQTRSATEILRVHQSKFFSGDRAAFETTAHIARLAPEFIRSLRGGHMREMGALLDLAWQLKRSIAHGVSNSYIDGLYARARACGAFGGKILGAGGGGYLLVLAPPESHSRIQSEMGLTAVPFEFESSGCSVTTSRNGNETSSNPYTRLTA